MKKLLGIVVLVFIITGCANQPATKQFSEDDPKILESTGQIFIGMKKKDFCWE